MPISDWIEDSPEARARRALLERKLALRKQLMSFKLSSLDMTVSEFGSFMRVMGLAQDSLGETKPSEEDVALFEEKLAQIRRIQEVMK